MTLLLVLDSPESVAIEDSPEIFTGHAIVDLSSDDEVFVHSNPSQFAIIFTSGSDTAER